MFTQRHFTESIQFLCFYCICYVSSIELVQLHDSSVIDVANKLVKFLDDRIIQLPRNDVKSINRNIKEALNVNNKFVKDKSPELDLLNVKKEDLNKVLWKGVVPDELPQPFKHGFGPYTGFEPVMRIHKKGKTANKRINKASNDKLQFLHFIKLNKFNNANDKKPSQATKKYKIVENNLQNKNKKFEKVEERDKYIKSMLKYLNFNGSPRIDPLRMEEEARKMAYRSAEMGTLMSAVGGNTESKSVTTTKKVKWLPKYPFWNYWTYKKTIYQDECPGNQIAMGRLCVWVPPH